MIPPPDDATYTAAQVQAWLERQAAAYAIASSREDDMLVSANLDTTALAIRMIAKRAPIGLATSLKMGRI